MSPKTLLRPTPLIATGCDRVPTATDDCPHCDVALLNAQGVLFCADCDWTGVAE